MSTASTGQVAAPEQALDHEFDQLATAVLREIGTNCLIGGMISLLIIQIENLSHRGILSTVLSLGCCGYGLGLYLNARGRRELGGHVLLTSVLATVIFFSLATQLAGGVHFAFLVVVVVAFLVFSTWRPRIVYATLGSGLILARPFVPDGQWLEVLVEPQWNGLTYLVATSTSIAGLIGYTTRFAAVYERFRQKYREAKEHEIAVVQQKNAELEDANAQLLGMRLQLFETARLATIGAMLAQVAHELNNPLTAVRGFAQLLAMQGPREELDMIISASDRMKETISRIRTNSQQVTNQKESPIDLGMIVDSVLSYMRFRLQENNVFVTRGYQTEKFFVSCNLIDLHSIVQNLIANALEELSIAKPREAVISVSIQEADTGNLILEVMDNGRGMDEEVMEKIFAPFFTTKKEHGGTGLGMPLVKHLVGQLGGEITIESKKDWGTAMRISLPKAGKAAISPSSEQKTSIHSELTADQAKQAKPSVLIVDDDVLVLKLLERYLSNEFRVSTSSDPEGILGQIIRSEKVFDCILVDYRMPTMDGFQFINAIKQVRPRPAIIMISGDLQIANRLDKLDFGLISKPFGDQKKICSIVQETITQWQEKGTGSEKNS